jgi:hypothetical protein
LSLHPAPGQNVQVPLEVKIHPRLVRGCKVRKKGESSSARCRGRTKGKPGRRQRQHNRKMPAKGKPGTASTARADAGFGETRRPADTNAAGFAPRGNPKDTDHREPGEAARGDPRRPKLAAPEGVRFGETRRTTGRARQGKRDGETRPSEPEATPKEAQRIGSRNRGDLKSGPSEKPEDEQRGNPRASSEGDLEC